MDVIYVCARSRVVARNFVLLDLDENPKKLCYIEHPDQLRGISHFMLFVHPTANEHPNFMQVRAMAEERGAIFARIDDGYSRVRYARGGR